jgi:hypothetical protein
VIFIVSAEETIPIADPRSVNRVGDAALHYKPAGGTIPLPINVLLGEGMDYTLQPHRPQPHISR